MAKNNKFINKQRYIAQQVESVVPSVYACIAMVLNEGNMPLDMIGDIFIKAQEKWENHNGNLTDMLVECYNETGIMLMTPKQFEKAKEEGLV